MSRIDFCCHRRETLKESAHIQSLCGRGPLPRFTRCTTTRGADVSQEAQPPRPGAHPPTAPRKLPRPGYARSAAAHALPTPAPTPKPWRSRHQVRARHAARHCAVSWPRQGHDAQPPGTAAQAERRAPDRSRSLACRRRPRPRAMPPRMPRGHAREPCDERRWAPEKQPRPRGAPWAAIASRRVAPRSHLLKRVLQPAPPP